MLARTFLRICALEALRPSTLIAADGPWPTLAGKFVYDSRLDPIDDLSEDEVRPIAVIFTEEDNLDRFAQHGPILYASTVDLVIEISTIGKARADDGEYAPGYAYLDPEIEAELDLLEHQIFWHLHFGPTGALFRKMAKLPLADWQSLPDRSSEEKVRLAKRTIRAKVPLRELCYEAAPLAPPTGLDRLPTLLAEIGAALSDTSAVRKLVDALAGGSPVAATRVDLETVGLSIDAHGTTGAAGAGDVEASADNLQS
jgi:hypothetical protein